MSFSWKELVCHGLLNKVRDPSLVKELLKMVMKEHMDLLEEEARVFQSDFVYPVVEVYCFNSRRVPWDRPTIIQEFERIRYSLSTILSPKMWLTAIRYKNVKEEFMSS
jgi:hypothetical protein